MQKNDFFIGWLPMPTHYSRFLAPIVIVLLIAASLAAVSTSFSQQSPGNAEWNEGDEVTLTGQVDAMPYAVLRINDHKLGKKTVFIVEQGKHGAFNRLSAFQGRIVSLKGTLLHRDDRWMLELNDGDQEIVPQSEGTLHFEPPTTTNLGLQTLHGEIIDSKCYLGAMKPGGGKTHKACAILCLKGGIPPMFITRDEHKRETYYLLTAPDGSALHPDCFDYAGDRIEVQGQVERVDDLLILRLNSSSIKRR